MEKKKARLTTTVDADLLRRAHQKRQETGRTIAHVVNSALRDWVENDPPDQGQQESEED